MADKRVRGSNFTNSEKSIFLDILSKYVGIIENKKTDGVTLRQKEDSWETLVNEFNSYLNVNKRNVKHLKSFYDNFKRKSKKNLADDKVDNFRTGGGTFTPRNDDDNYRLLSLLKDQIDPLPNSRDSDANYHQGLGFSSLDATANDITVEGDVEPEIVQLTYEGTPVPLLESTVNIPPHDDQKAGVTTDVHGSQQMSTPTSQSWKSRNRPINRRRESDALSARKSVAALADQRKEVVALETKILLDRAVKDDELRALKFKVEEEKLRAYDAKRRYYEKKLDLISK